MTRQTQTEARNARKLRRSRHAPERAEFLARFPKNPELTPATEAFVSGNYREVRRICEGLLANDNDPDVKDAARELLRRLEPDRLIVGILWGSLVLLIVISLWAFGHG